MEGALKWKELLHKCRMQKFLVPSLELKSVLTACGAVRGLLSRQNSRSLLYCKY